jgi:hypothetical protein
MNGPNVARISSSATLNLARTRLRVPTRRVTWRATLPPAKSLFSTRVTSGPTNKTRFDLRSADLSPRASVDLSPATSTEDDGFSMSSLALDDGTWLVTRPGGGLEWSRDEAPICGGAIFGRGRCAQGNEHQLRALRRTCCVRTRPSARRSVPTSWRPAAEFSSASPRRRAERGSSPTAATDPPCGTALTRPCPRSKRRCKGAC